MDVILTLLGPEVIGLVFLVCIIIILGSILLWPEKKKTESKENRKTLSVNSTAPKEIRTKNVVLPDTKESGPVYQPTTRKEQTKPTTSSGTRKAPSTKPLSGSTPRPPATRRDDSSDPVFVYSPLIHDYAESPTERPDRISSSFSSSVSSSSCSSTRDSGTSYGGSSYSSSDSGGSSYSSSDSGGSCSTD